MLALLNLLDQFGASNNLSTRGTGFLGEFALGKDEDDGVLFDGLLEEDGGADRLRVLLGFGVCLDVDFDQVVGFADFLCLFGCEEQVVAKLLLSEL